jgi:hypothetical protein
MGKQVAIVFGLAFVVALAVVGGNQMSAEAMAVVVGVVCGVAAGIPTSLLILVALTRRERQAMERAQRQPEQPGDRYPSVVVIRQDPAMSSVLEAECWLQAPPGPDGRFSIAERGDRLPDGG